MEFIAPMPFAEAIRKLGSQSVVGSTFSSSEWADVPVELGDNAFFSSRIESAQFLQRAKDALGDFLAGNQVQAENGEMMLSVGSRAAFVSQMQNFLAGEGVTRTHGGLTDIAGEKRLGLIFDIKSQQAQDFGYWKQGMNPAVLNEFPAQRFIRVRSVKAEREAHIPYEDQVYLKTDPIWWRVINKDFGVPWGPWGWGCGHDVEDVDRDEAEALHLIKPGQVLKPLQLSMNHNLQASIKNLDPELVEKLKREFGDKITIERDAIRWNEKAGGPAPTVSPGSPALPIDRDRPTSSRSNPVSDAVVVKVRGDLRAQVRIALEAIDAVHDDGVLESVPLVGSMQSTFGFMRAETRSGRRVTSMLAVRGSGPWPALTAVHEIGHMLDLMAIGQEAGQTVSALKGGFASESGVMRGVMAAIEQTTAVKNLRERMASSGSPDVIAYYMYLLRPVELWARAYAQFVASRSGNKVLTDQLVKATAHEADRQWEAGDFAGVDAAIGKLFKVMGWIK